MGGSFADKQYVYAVARIRGAETALLTASVMEQLISAESADACMRILSDRGYGSGALGETEESLIASERAKLWALMAELVPDLSVFNVFRVQNDYHNLKAAIRASVMQFDYPDIYIADGTADWKLIRDAIRSRSYAALPEGMRAVAERAHDVFLRTRDGQRSDLLIDRAALEAVRAAGAQSGQAFLELYAELTVAAADIKIAVRAAKTGKSAEFLSEALCPCASLDTELLLKAASTEGVGAIAAYLENTDYADAAEALKKSTALFERWCDDFLIERIRTQQSNPFGLGPLAAYILAREAELKSVRVILSAKRNGFSAAVIRERVRETYV